jgi:hypothetical protein
VRLLRFFAGELRSALPECEKCARRGAVSRELIALYKALRAPRHDACRAVGAEDPHMAKYGRKASEKVEKAMHERKRGTLKSGRSGKKIKSRKQAIAIGLAQARRAGGKVPRRRSSSKEK